MHCSMAGSDASAPGRCSIWQLLVELLMISSSMGQAAVLQHLAETHSNRLLLPLQEAVRHSEVEGGKAGRQSKRTYGLLTRCNKQQQHVS